MKLTGKKVFDVFNVLLMWLLLVITAYPFYYIIIASFSDPVKLASHSGILLLPLAPYEFGAYKEIFNLPLLLSGFRNTIFIVVVGTTLNIIFSALGAYFLSQNGPMFKGVVATIVIITMYFNGGMIPNYNLVRSLGLYNNTKRAEPNLFELCLGERRWDEIQPICQRTRQDDSLSEHLRCENSVQSPI